MNCRITYTLLILLASLLCSLPLSANQLASQADTEPRLSTSTINGVVTKNHYSSDGWPASATKLRLDRYRTVQQHNHGLWFFDVLINLTTDVDYDGHYSTFSVSLDLESSFEPRYVYAVLYLRQSNGPWLEYAVTNNFTVSGFGSSDAILIETSLDSGYASGYYDHYVEIFDAYTGDMLLTYGPNDSHHVHRIPFESYYHDSYVSPVSLRLSYTATGSFSATTLLFFLVVIALKFRTRVIGVRQSSKKQ